MPNSEEIQLGKAAGWQDGGAGGEEVGQHPGDHSRGVEHLQPGGVAQEEVHGRVQGSVSQVRRMISELQQSDQVDQSTPRTEGPGETVT